MNKKINKKEVNKMNIKEDKITTYKVNKLRRALVLEFMDMGLTFKEAETKANVLFYRTFINDKPIIGRPYVTTI